MSRARRARNDSATRAQPGSRWPTVTVAIPTYNRAAMMRTAVLSVTAQSYRALRIVISDNCSTDDTRTVALALADSDSRIAYVRRARNLGPERNFAATLAEATSHYFMWLADDDWLDPDYVRDCVAVLSEDEEIAIVSGDVRYWRDGHVVERDRPTVLLSKVPARRVLAMSRIGGRHGWYYGVGRTSVMRRARLRSTLGGDFVYLADLAALGQVQAVTSAGLNRRLDGESADPRALARRFGLHPAWGQHHFLWIGWVTAREILGGSAAMRQCISIRHRVVLAPMVFAAYLRHWCMHFVVAEGWVFVHHVRTSRADKSRQPSCRHSLGRGSVRDQGR